MTSLLSFVLQNWLLGIVFGLCVGWILADVRASARGRSRLKQRLKDCGCAACARAAATFRAAGR